MIKIFKKKIGVSLVELIVGIGIFALVVGSVSMFSTDAIRANANARKRIEAATYMQEMLNAIITIKNDNWPSIINSTGTGNKKIVFQNNKYQLVDGAEVRDGYTITINIDPVLRDSAGNIVLTGGSQDFRTRSIITTISWTDFLNINQSISSVMYVNNWNAYIWKQTTKTDFDSGTYNLTASRQSGDGEVQLQVVAYPDWCKPTLSLSAQDLPGSGISTSVQAIQGEAFIGTGSGSTSVNFMDIGISNTQPPIATVLSTYTGNKANAVFGEANYAYLATDADTKEVIILDITGANPVEVGYFNAPGTANANSVYVIGNKGYVTTTDSNLYVFDLSSKSGSRPQLGVKTLMGEGTKVQIVGSYAYISLTGGAHIELQVLNISDPANIYTVGTGNTNQSDASDLFVNSDGSRTYVGTASSAEKEFIIFDTSNKPSQQNLEYFQESGGIVSIEAENFHSNLARNGKSWSLQTGGSPTGASADSFMVAGPDTGTVISSDYFNTSPELGYRVNFSNTGTYYFWVRAYANNSGNNGVHGGYDGANFPNVEALSTSSYNSWRWFRGSIDIRTPELHWINIWMQDDGFRLDKIYLTKNSSFTPTGTGPAESTRTTSSIIMPELNRQLGQYESNGMSIKGVTSVENNTRAILVGTGGQEYQVLDITNESNPSKCGGLDVNAGIMGVSSIKESDNDAYSYIVTKEANSEFRIIRGGPGEGGGGEGNIYASSGLYTSQPYDTGTTSTVYLGIKPSFQLIANTNIKLQIRTGDSISEINSNQWLGPDGTSSSYYTSTIGTYIPVSVQGKRYIQYQATFSSDSNGTPLLESVEIDYIK